MKKVLLFFAVLALSFTMVACTNENYEEIAKEVKTLESIFENIISKILETTSAKFERDFHFTEI